jgi:hypothetical protein
VTDYELQPGELSKSMLNYEAAAQLDPRQQELYFHTLESAEMLIEYYYRDDWKTKSNKKGHHVKYITEQRPDPNGKMEKITLVRSELWFETHPRDIALTISDMDQCYKYDEYMASDHMVEAHEGVAKIYRFTWKKMLVISSRETVLCTADFTGSNGAMICVARSIDHPDWPVTDDPVRAFLYCGGWILMP